MVNLNDSLIFLRNLTTLEQTSCNSAQKGKRRYMTESQKVVINFDDVTKEYVKTFSRSRTPSSIDALLQVKEKVFFIEFKDGVIDKKDIYEIWKKIYDSLLLYCDITKEHISGTKKYMTFILVYNGTVNKQCSQLISSATASLILNPDEVQVAPSRMKYMSAIAQNATQKNVDYFKLREEFEGIYFCEVLTYEKNIFSDALLV